MAYLVASEINPHLPGRLAVTASSTPNLTDLSVYIAGVSAELDSAAAQGGYALPIASPGSPESFSLLQMFSIYGVGWRALNVMMPNQGGPKDLTSLATRYHDDYERALQMLRDGTLILSDAPHDDSGTSGGRILPRSYSTSNVGATVGVVPQVTIGRDQF